MHQTQRVLSEGSGALGPCPSSIWKIQSDVLPVNLRAGGLVGKKTPGHTPPVHRAGGPSSQQDSKQK